MKIVTKNKEHWPIEFSFWKKKFQKNETSYPSSNSCIFPVSTESFLMIYMLMKRNY